MKNKVLVTGAGGFIGSHLVERLVKDGHEVRAMVRYTSQSYLGNLAYLDKKTIKEIEIVKGDLKDPQFCSRVTLNCHAIFHLAAITGVPYSYLSPLDCVETNAVGTTNLLISAKESKSLERFVHVSTSEIYGTARYTPIDETHPLQAQSPYSASKICAEKMAESFYCSYDLPVTIIRLFNTFGPRQSRRAVIPTIISQLQVSDKIQLGSTAPKRDFLYVRDSARGISQVGLHPKTVGQTLNLGTGVSISVKELAESIAELMGKRFKFLKDASRVRPKKSEVFNLLADASKAQKITGWKPEYRLTDGLQSTIDWFQEFTGSFDPEDYMV